MPLFVALLVTAPYCVAELSASVSTVSDFRFRGISESSRRPAAQGSVAYDHVSGAFAGLFVSAVRFDLPDSPDVKAFAHIGAARRLNDDWSWEASLGRYEFLGSDTFDFDYEEFSVGVTWRQVNLRAHFAPDYFNSGVDSSYVEINAIRYLTRVFALFAHVGHTFQPDNDKYRSRLDVRAGVSFETGVLNVELAGTATSSGNHECPALRDNCAPGVVVSATVNF